MKTFLLSILLIIVLSSTSLFSQCYECTGQETTNTITYSVPQVGCGQCEYTVTYKQCSTSSSILIESIESSASNPVCCQGTAINDPMVSGYILDEAANQIALVVGGTLTIYTPSKCWKWEGHLGPNGIHTAVLVTCSFNISCCVYVYENGNLTSHTTKGAEVCNECMPLCE